MMKFQNNDEVLEKLAKHAIDRIDEKRKEYGTPTDAVKFYLRKFDYMEEDIRAALKSFKTHTVLGSDAYYGPIYTDFLYDAFQAILTFDDFLTLKLAAEGISTLFGDEAEWDQEAELERYTEKAKWTSTEHLHSLIIAYNCQVSGIDVTEFLNTADKIKKIINKGNDDANDA